MKLILEQLEKSDFLKIRHWIDPNIFRIFKSPIDDEQLELLLSKYTDGTPTELGMRAIDADTGEMVGIIHAIINSKNDLMHIQQIVIHPDLRGQGYGQAILKSFMEKCFAQLNLHRIQLFTEENNKSAIACYRQVGFKIDGILRDHVKTMNGYLSTYVFSVLNNEWR